MYGMIFCVLVYWLTCLLLTLYCVDLGLQLRIEQRAGRVFKGWNEGNIYFAPTYKYLTNSDHYVAQSSKSKEKQRTPAW